MRVKITSDCKNHLPLSQNRLADSPGKHVVASKRLWSVDESGLLSLMVLVLIGEGILANRMGRMNNEIPFEDL